MARRKSKLEIAKGSDGYYRVYKNDGRVAIPYSPYEFSNITDARKWLRNHKTTMNKTYEVVK